MSLALDLAERGLLPDFVIRHGIRKLLRERLRCESRTSLEQQSASLATFADECRHGPIALETPAANAQHYEVPTAFFQKILGPRLKYSCCLFPQSSNDSPLVSTPRGEPSEVDTQSCLKLAGDDAAGKLADAEILALQTASQRAELADGQSILELGCGWGSWALWIAEQYPHSQIVGVSNSRTQKAFIDEQAGQRGLTNLRIITCDMNRFDPGQTFDRVVSTEMFEHMHNFRELLRRVRSWLNPGGKLFVHIFCHRTLAYPFASDGADNWMGRHFFTGGMMPSFDWFAHFADDMRVEARWAVNGVHYANTLDAWLANLDRQRAELLALFPAPDARRQLQRWRMFLMACSELFGFADGREWLVGHYRLAKRE